MSTTKKMAIIGGGNLGSSIAQGLLKSNFILPQNLTITKRNIGTLEHFKSQGVSVEKDNLKAIKQSEIILVALKPYNIREILQELKDAFIPGKHLLISVVTGVLMDDLEKIVGPEIPIIRAMPNTAIAIQQSITCICHRHASGEEVDWVEELFRQLGIGVIIDEKLMDAATVLGACGIAYALRYIRANIQGGIEIGFDAKTASLIAAQTVKGAAELLIQQKRHPEEEIDKVTTPKGCTIAGLNEMEHQGFSSSLIKGIITSYQKIGKP
ncbi:MAG: pyrroline-5-carboxylate reductase [Chitinophagaceae bacterium]